MDSKEEKSRIVLIVEDEPVIATALADEMMEAGYQIAGPFATRAASIEWLEANESPDLAIIDTILVDGPCGELAQRLAINQVPFIVYSGWVPGDADLPELRAARWVGKPATFGEIAQAASQLLFPLSPDCENFPAPLRSA